MELWIIDRSGPYSSGPFDIHDEPDKFARAFVGYATMDDDVMGLDTFIERENGHRYITLDDASGDETRIRLAKAMVRQRAIVCRGTTCYETRNSHVAKLSWASDKRKLEVEQLKLAEERGFRNDAVHFDDQPSATASANTSGNKPKSSSDNTSDNASRSKRRRSNSQKSKLATECNDQLSIARNKPSLYTPGEDLWENRIYSCLVVSPAGRVISDFKTIRGTAGPELADGCKGMLIDLDLAKVRDSGPSGARHQTGTMQFMAVEVLRKAGTGKSSLSLSVAGRFGLDIYAVSVSTVSDRSLEDLFAQLPPKCVVLLEDIDAAGATHSRDAGGENAHERGNPADTKSVTPSGLLNAIDGVASQEGRLLIMTTNHIEKLDGALIRPGRIDTQIKFQLVDRDLATQIYHFVFEQPD
ncbi:hypothetical protein QQZ08_012146 [Neonectria magnoliae]|uniref:ATPase AAA-type core domain-containing protein n=1 Tax=Neonectria magnoliae TaxID=2732573 RepID=A0ABR1H4M6_9HYPO